MKSPLRTILSAPLCMVLACALLSCRNEICYDHYPTLDIGFTWEQEWERDYGNHHLNDWDHTYYAKHYDELRPWIPEWINMVQYQDNGQTHETYLTPSGGRFHVNGSDGDPVLLYNGDTEYIILSNLTSLETACATATSRSRASLVMERHPGARSTNPPDVLYAAYFEHGPSVRNHEIKQMAVNMKPLVYTYIIVYEFDKGLDQVAQARGALGGMAESVYLQTGTTSDDASIILYDCEILPHACKAEVRSFGVPGFPDSYYRRALDDAPDRPYTLNLEVRLTRGKVLSFDFDVSEQLEKQPRGGVIKVTGLTIEEEQNEETGYFIVGVDGWDEGHEDINLPIGGQKK